VVTGISYILAMKQFVTTVVPFRSLRWTNNNNWYICLFTH